jgi:DNA-binding LacI/PurR family transcriptional regulator
MLDLQYRLMEAGHTASFAARTLLDLEMDAKRMARLVHKTNADAWVVFGGLREVHEWFAAQPVPAFAVFGRRRNVPIAGTGPDKLPALILALDRLVKLGHRRIVMLVREERCKSQPGPVERCFLETMKAHGLSTSAYNLPDWDNSAESFRRCFDSSFRITPPTALTIDRASLFVVAQQHLARRGILSPEHVSLVSCDPDPAFGWFSPSVAHIHWEPQQVVRRVLQWADNVTRGKDDRRQPLTKAKFIEGGTIGPARLSMEL